MLLFDNIVYGTKRAKSKANYDPNIQPYTQNKSRGWKS